MLLTFCHQSNMCLKPPDSKSWTRTHSPPTTGWGRLRSTSSHWLLQPEPMRPPPSQILPSLTNGWQKMASGSRGTAPSPSSTARWSRWSLWGFRMLSVATLRWSSSASLSLNSRLQKKGKNGSPALFCNTAEAQQQEFNQTFDYICRVGKELQDVSCDLSWGMSERPF